MDEKEEQVVLDPEYTCITCTHVACVSLAS